MPTPLVSWIPWLIALGVFAAIMAAGLSLQYAVTCWLRRQPEDWHPFLKHSWHRVRRLLRFMLALLAAAVALQMIPMPQGTADAVRRIFTALFTIQMGWIVMVAANLAMDRYVQGLALGSADNLLARKAATQMRIFRQALNVLLVVLTVAFALMSFEAVRQVGVSLFASAGVAGIVAGLAARPLLENLFAGVQLALTQPLRLEDAVVINNEWGWVEEINSTYIVVRLWDWRRQVVPLSYLFANPFTNWTRSSAALIGTVFLYADYTLPMDAIRAEAERIAKASPRWDGKVINVQVSDAREQVMEVRVLASARDSPTAWDLRCEIREKLIAYIRDNFPESLPRVRREDYRLAETMAPEGAAHH